MSDVEYARGVAAVTDPVETYSDRRQVRLHLRSPDPRIPAPTLCIAVLMSLGKEHRRYLGSPRLSLKHINTLECAELRKEFASVHGRCYDQAGTTEQCPHRIREEVNLLGADQNRNIARHRILFEPLKH